MSRMRIRDYFAIATPMVLAIAFFVGLVELWGIPASKLFSVLGTVVLFMAGLMALALAALVLIRFFRKRFRR